MHILVDTEVRDAPIEGAMSFLGIFNRFLMSLQIQCSMSYLRGLPPKDIQNVIYLVPKSSLPNLHIQDESYCAKKDEAIGIEMK